MSKFAIVFLSFLNCVYASNEIHYSLNKNESISYVLLVNKHIDTIYDKDFIKLVLDYNNENWSSAHYLPIGYKFSVPVEGIKKEESVKVNQPPIAAAPSSTQEISTWDLDRKDRKYSVSLGVFHEEMGARNAINYDRTLYSNLSQVVKVSYGQHLRKKWSLQGEGIFKNHIYESSAQYGTNEDISFFMPAARVNAGYKHSIDATSQVYTEVGQKLAFQVDQETFGTTFEKQLYSSLGYTFEADIFELRQFLMGLGFDVSTNLYSEQINKNNNYEVFSYLKYVTGEKVWRTQLAYAVNQLDYNNFDYLNRSLTFSLAFIFQ
ncbi:MAG: hypothetical protein H6621_02215 [Halobacteriovoraceae bacterium]|nr:hypothetical protein [Halobacteriovoraceae bacterium]MCB9093858.1 hypothetical protein [Halobacteriovoraceae bacterium]